MPPVKLAFISRHEKAESTGLAPLRARTRVPETILGGNRKPTILVKGQFSRPCHHSMKGRVPSRWFPRLGETKFLPTFLQMTSPSHCLRHQTQEDFRALPARPVTHC